MPDGDRVDVTVGEVVWDLVAVADGDCEFVADGDTVPEAEGVAVPLEVGTTTRVPETAAISTVERARL